MCAGIDALVPRTARLQLLGRRCEVRPLSIKAAIKLGRVVGAMRAQIQEAAGGDNKNILAAIFELAGPRETKEIINIFTSNAFEDVQNLDEQLTLKDLSELTKAVFEVNDFEAICANFTSALGGNTKPCQAR